MLKKQLANDGHGTVKRESESYNRDLYLWCSLPDT